MDLKIRQATLNDAEAITQIELVTNFQIPSFNYVYPYSNQYPNDTYKYTLSETKSFIMNSNNAWGYAVFVAEARLDESKNANATVIAMSVFEVSALQKSKASVESLEFLLGDSQENTSTGEPNLPMFLLLALLC